MARRSTSEIRLADLVGRFEFVRLGRFHYESVVDARDPRSTAAFRRRTSVAVIVAVLITIDSKDVCCGLSSLHAVSARLTQCRITSSPHTRAGGSDLRCELFPCAAERAVAQVTDEASSPLQPRGGSQHTKSRSWPSSGADDGRRCGHRGWSCRRVPPRHAQFWNPC